MGREAWQAPVHGDHKELDTTEQLTVTYIYIYICILPQFILCYSYKNRTVFSKLVFMNHLKLSYVYDSLFPETFPWIKCTPK